MSVTPVGGEFIVNSATVGKQIGSSITALGSGFLVTWTDMQPSTDDTSLSAVRGQIYDANRNPVGGPFLINMQTNLEQTDSSVVELSDNNFAVVWQDTSGTLDDDFPSRAIHAKVFNVSEGIVTVVTEEFRVNTTAAGNQIEASVTALSDGGFVVTWRHDTIVPGGPDLSDVRAKIYDNSGAMVLDEFLVNTSPTNSQQRPDVAALDDGGFIIVWQDQLRQFGTTSEIVGRHFDADGNPVADSFPINTTTESHQLGPVVTGLTGGGYVVVWYDQSELGIKGEELRGQIYNATGVPVGIEFTVNTTSSSDQTLPDIAALGNGGFVVTWTDFSGDNSYSGVRGQAFTAAGVKEGPEFLINSTTQNYQEEASVTAFGESGFVVAWTDYSEATPAPDASAANIRAQVFETATGPGNTPPQITSNGGGSTASINIPENSEAVTTVTATDADSNPLTYTIVSVDNGGAPDAAKFQIHPTTGVLTFVAAPDFETPTDAGANNVYDVTVEVSDGNGGTDRQDIAITVTDVPTESQAMNLFFPSTPSQLIDDTQGVELGFKFQSSTTGTINSVLFYKPATETGSHEGHLWFADGTLLAVFTFSNETASGWQTATLNQPVLISANTTYVASYHSNGDYGYTAQAFQNSVVSGDLTALASGASGGNGVFSYTVPYPTNVFPTNSFNNANYWVDVAYTPYGGPNRAPVIDGGASSAFSVPEGTTLVADLGATDLDDDTIFYSIVGGLDRSKFQIDGNTGVLTFASAPDYENPTDVGGDRVYNVIVQASDGTFSSYVQQVAVTVTDVLDNAAPTGLSFGSFLGHHLNLDYRFPNQGTILNAENLGPQSFTAGTGVEVAAWGPAAIGGVNIGINVDLGGSTILFDYDGTFTGPWGPGWSGPHLADTAGTLPDIIGVSILDQGGLSPALDNADLTFDANNIYVNWAGTSYNLTPDTRLKLAVTFAGGTASIAENTPIGTGVKVSEFSFADDGVGTNNVSVTDSTNFEVRTNASGAYELYYIGPSPDFESQALYTTEVRVDDPTINGTTPELAQTFTLNVIDALGSHDYNSLLSGDYWSGIERDGTPVFVTYSFPTAAPPSHAAVVGDAYSTFQEFSAAQKEQARAALQEWADASGLTVLEVAPGEGQINFALYDLPGTGLGSGGMAFNPFGDWNGLTYTDFPKEAAFFSDTGDGVTDASGDVFVNASALPGSGIIPYDLLLHEIGHALGLKHPFEPLLGGTTGVPRDKLDPSLDNTDNTVMSYTLGSLGAPTSLRAFDIQAIQFIYGTNTQDGSQVASSYWNSGTATLTQTGYDGVDDIMRGVSVSDIMSGGAGNDRLFGLGGNDTLDGGAGNDELWGGFGNDTLTGGAGSDTFYAMLFDESGSQTDIITDFSVAEDTIDLRLFGPRSFWGPASEAVLRTHMLDPFKTGAALLYTWYNGFEQSMTLTGVSASALTSASFVFDTSATPRTMIGTDNGDVLFGGLGNDTLNGGGGDDLLIGDAGDDMLIGGTGTNRYDGGAGADTFDGSLGLDRVDYNTIGGITLILNGSGVAGPGSLGEAAGDTFIGIESIRATNEADVITLDTTVGTLMGMGGNDVLTGSSDINDIQGGDGDDTIISGGGNDALRGNAGNDTITITGTYTLAQALGGTGNDTLNGGDFSDILYGEADNDTLNGGGGSDYLYGDAGADLISGGDGNDFMFDADGMSGDQYSGGSGYDRVTYTTGGTFDFSAEGADTFGADIENVIFTVAVDVTGSSNADTYTGSGSIDTLRGGGGNDLINGGGGADILIGNAGNDRLFGNDGDDWIRGGTGSDAMRGEAGADTFYFATEDIDTIDRILDFQVGTDTIGLDATSFGLTAGALDPNRFYTFGDTITETGSVFVYRASDGAVFWDADGSGTGGLTAMTYLNGSPALTAGDFVVV